MISPDQIKVTGAAGFIGSWLSHYLKIPQENRFDVLTGQDITDPKTQEQVVTQAITIVHLAAISGVKKCQEEQALATNVNAKASLELALMAKQAGVRRFILASSSAVYGEAQFYRMDETHPTNPRTVYGRTKLLAEEVLGLADHRFEVVILRKSNVFGYGVKWKKETVLDSFIDRYLEGRPIEIQGNGNQRRDFVHLTDVMRLYVQLATAEKVRSGVYNVGGIETVSIGALAQLVNELGASMMGAKVPILYTGNDQAGWHDFYYDWSKARMEFLYRPVFTLDDHIKERLHKAMRE